MKKVEWLKYFEEHNLKFLWFFNRYGFQFEWNSLTAAHKIEDTTAMMAIMNDVWFKLPDNIFNIRGNPRGWPQFLTLLENPPN